MRLLKTVLGIFLLLTGIPGCIVALAMSSEQPGGAVCSGLFWALMVFVGFQLLQSKRPDWRTLPPTEKQIDYAEDLGIDFDARQVTRGELSDMISEVTGR